MKKSELRRLIKEELLKEDAKDKKNALQLLYSLNTAIKKIKLTGSDATTIKDCLSTVYNLINNSKE